MRTLLLFLLLIPACVVAQTTITGKVTDANGKPLANVNVFLSNALAGTHTIDDGSFTLVNVKAGQYDMVVSVVGYEPYHQNLNANNNTISLPPIMLMVKNNQLKEVRIGPPDPRRNRYLEMFTREFLGSSENSVDCKILNPEILDLDYSNEQRTLSASSDDFLIIENKALGYKIHYQLTHFTMTFSGQMSGGYSTYYDGNVFFENLPGKPSQLKKWEKKRMETYQGSSMHFLRSVIGNSVTEQGFTVLRLIRKPNTKRPSDEFIRSKVVQFSKTGLTNDSLAYWRDKFNLPKMFEYLVKTPLASDNYVQRVDAKNIYALSFADHLYIAYNDNKKKWLDTSSLEVRPPRDAKYSISIVTINKRFAIFDQNGIFTDPTSTVVEGFWGKLGNADLLPVDYEPVKK